MQASQHGRWNAYPEEFRRVLKALNFVAGDLDFYVAVVVGVRTERVLVDASSLLSAWEKRRSIEDIETFVISEMVAAVEGIFRDIGRGLDAAAKLDRPHGSGSDG